MKKRILLLSTLIFTGLMMACGNAKEIVDAPRIEAFNLNDTVVLNFSEIYMNNEDPDLFVVFESIISDSRCPEGATCIWEGNAEVGIAVTYKKEIDKLKLNTAKEMETTKAAFGYNFELLGLTPYPGAADAETGKRTITLVVSKEK